MPTEAIINLEQLRCITLKDFETRVEPYIWSALIKIDNNTINAPGGRFVDVIIPVEANAQVKIKDSMRAGETAPIPDSVRRLFARFEDGSTNRQLILIVTLLEMDETPKHAMRAGFRAYGAELRAAFKEEFRNLFIAANDEEEQKIVIERIKKRVAKKVRSAIENDLSLAEKVKANFQDQDDNIGTAVAKFSKDPLAPSPIILDFEAKNTITVGFNPPQKIETLVRYSIRGRLQVQPVRIDPCKRQVDAVTGAQSAVNSINQEIKILQAELNGKFPPNEPPRPKSFIIKEIKRIRDEELPPAMAALRTAREALNACRQQQSLVIKSPVSVLGTN
jgi:hypothetical protein